MGEGRFGPAGFMPPDTSTTLPPMFVARVAAGHEPSTSKG